MWFDLLINNEPLFPFKSICYQAHRDRLAFSCLKVFSSPGSQNAGKIK